MPAAAFLLSLLAVCAPARADEYARLAAELAAAARKAGVTRVAVAAPEAVGEAGAAGPAVVSERLLSQLARQAGLQVVERRLLDRVLQEQRLAHSGAVAPGDAPALGRLMGVDAVVTGSMLALAPGRVELDMRLVGASDARVLGTAVARVEPDWDDSAAAPVPALDAPPPPSLDTDFTAFWEKPRPAADGRCAGWEERVDQLQGYSLPLKARYWAARLAAGLDPRAVTSNPGSEIRSLETRAAFYAAVRRDYASGTPPLDAREARALKEAETEAGVLVESCDR